MSRSSLSLEELLLLKQNIKVYIRTIYNKRFVKDIYLNFDFYRCSVNKEGPPS